jgi:hypothetical protein
MHVEVLIVIFEDAEIAPQAERRWALGTLGENKVEFRDVACVARAFLAATDAAVIGNGMTVVVEEVAADVGIAGLADDNPVAKTAHDVVMDEIAADVDLLRRRLIVRCVGDIYGGESGQLKISLLSTVALETPSMTMAPLATGMLLELDDGPRRRSPVTRAPAPRDSMNC